ncbi:cyclase family protein [Rippkaea orientalis PCC 8801]|uniref:Kynurenine formamidase n=1 Tax=Rippkaea orientalis (strain PCC 8801 / RF-1) TaxID=41431 RepID=B7JZJ6_RIPO1|nr:cyclase family protein [Rippkaea orientalis]ACK64156.1 cyclase family protein [Rippkaea orientalis PCC 8801]
MSRYIDISVSVSANLPCWPGSPPVKFTRDLDLDKGDIANDTSINFSVHTGTHIDAPLHFIQGGNSVDQVSLDILIGKAYVADLSTVDVITTDILKQLSLPTETTRLLLKTKNSQLWEAKGSEFNPDFVAITADAAQWLVGQGIKLVGIDYLSIQRFYDGPETHQILLGAEVVIIEGLNLTQVSSGEYQLICLPIKLQGIEGAPARVILQDYRC